MANGYRDGPPDPIKDGIPSKDAGDYASIRLTETSRLKRLYDELPNGDIGLGLIADELERRREPGWF